VQKRGRSTSPPNVYRCLACPLRPSRDEPHPPSFRSPHHAPNRCALRRRPLCARRPVRPRPGARAPGDAERSAAGRRAGRDSHFRARSPRRQRRPGLAPLRRWQAADGARHQLGLRAGRRELRLLAVGAARRGSREGARARHGPAARAARQRHPRVLRHAGPVDPPRLREVRHLHRAQPHGGPLRPRARRGVDSLDRLLQPAHPRGAQGAGARARRADARHAGPVDVDARQREQLRPLLGERGDRKPAAGEAARRAGRCALLADGRAHRRHPRGGPRAPGDAGQRRSAVHRLHRHALQAPRRDGRQRLPRPLGGRPLRRGEGQARGALPLHRVRRRRLERAHHARRRGVAGQRAQGAVAGNRRAELGQGPRRQRHRRLRLPVGRRLVEVRARRAARRARHQRLVVQRRLPRRLRAGRKQHERRVVGHHGPRHHGAGGALSPQAARRLLPLEAGLPHRPLRGRSHPRQHRRAVERPRGARRCAGGGGGPGSGVAGAVLAAADGARLRRHLPGRHLHHRRLQAPRPGAQPHRLRQHPVGVPGRPPPTCGVAW
jgi:hypothetical protein